MLQIKPKKNNFLPKQLSFLDPNFKPDDSFLEKEFDFKIKKVKALSQYREYLEKMKDNGYRKIRKDAFNLNLPFD